ncbi:MAG: type II toxin-antitoxin system RelB family antitoxin [Allosphingosinicella sp.]
MNKLSPLVSEFETVEQAEAYRRWLEDKVAASRADGRPTISHDEAMERVRAVIEAKAGRHSSGPGTGLAS